MSKVKKTTHDGWECVPELKRAVRALNGMDQDVYEIKHCVRASKLEHLVENMKECLQEALEELDYINVDVEFETVDDDE